MDYIKVGPRRWWPNPESKRLKRALAKLAVLPSRDRRLVRYVIGAYIVAVFTGRRDREACIRKIRAAVSP